MRDFPLLAGKAAQPWHSLNVQTKVRSSFSRTRRIICVQPLFLALGLVTGARAQNLPNAPQPQAAQDTDSVVTLRDLPRNILSDQKAIWTSPIRIRPDNLGIPVALVLSTTVAITADHQAMSSLIANHESIKNESVTASNGMLAVLGAAPIYFYAAGKAKQDDKAVETGILGAQAMGDSIIVSEAMKIVSRRERPTVDNAKGKFFQPGVRFDSSSPSNHAFLAWSAASVIATEYPGPFTQIAAYSLATGVSITRVLGQQHFPSDVVVGSFCGWLIGRYVVHHHRRSY